MDELICTDGLIVFSEAGNRAEMSKEPRNRLEMLKETGKAQVMVSLRELPPPLIQEQGNMRICK